MAALAVTAHADHNHQTYAMLAIPGRDEEGIVTSGLGKET
jgi:hypothetical protein